MVGNFFFQKKVDDKRLFGNAQQLFKRRREVSQRNIFQNTACQYYVEAGGWERNPYNISMFKTRARVNPVRDRSPRGDRSHALRHVRNEVSNGVRRAVSNGVKPPAFRYIFFRDIKTGIIQKIMKPVFQKPAKVIPGSAT